MSLAPSLNYALALFRIWKNHRKIIESNTQLAQQRMKLQYDKHTAPVPFDIGSKVWVYTPKNRKGLSKKLAHNYHGPYRVTAKIIAGTF